MVEGSITTQLPSLAAPLTGPASVLVVDDDDGSLALLAAILEPLGQNVVIARSGEEALRLSAAEEFAVVLLDVSMPGMDGFETARRMKDDEAQRHVPIIFLTGAAERDEVARGYSTGAVDYLLKPYEPHILRSKVQVFVDLHRLRKQAEILTHRALHDPLTGLPNRTLLLDRLEIALARVDRTQKPVALLFVDLDKFKQVNDTLGHHAGDQLLVDVAGRLQQSIRASDTAARFGGDEFVVLADGVADRAEAETIAARIHEALGRVPVSACVGIALAERPDTAPEELIREADAAMLETKGSAPR
jgi:diguanylate cyclase (GGDEF)-like protein